jgi:hypothetical protein
MDLQTKRILDEENADLMSKKQKVGEANDDSDFVQSVMAAPKLVQHAPADSDFTVLGHRDTVSTSLDIMGSSGVKPDDIQTILSAIRGMQDSFNTRLDQIEKRVSEHVLKVVRVEMSEVRASFQGQVDSLSAKITAMESTYASVASKTVENTDCSVVIKNVKVDPREEQNSVHTLNAVHKLIREGVQLSDVKVVSAERKRGYGNKPGVIVVKLETQAQKIKLMKSKKSLKNTPAYNQVYIDNDLPRDVRNTENSLRILLKEVGKDKDYFVRGTRLMRRTPQ